jgi:hypothetical protein
LFCNFYFVVFTEVVFPEVALPEVELRIIGVGAGGVAGVGAWCVPVGGVGVINRVGGPPAAKTDSVRKILVAVTAITLNFAMVIVKMTIFVLALI